MSKQETRSDGVKTFQAASRAIWRQWLADHWDQEKSVWLIIYKKDSKVATVKFGDAVSEALCFGWIDSKINRRDDKSYYQYFARRNPKSNWSRVNKAKVEKLIAAGLMSEPGYQMIAEAKERGTWTALDDVENLVIPPDLQAEFDQYPIAFQYYDAFPRSVKRSILEWIFNAKRPATRQKRISETVQLAAENIRANQYQSRK